MEVSSDDTVVQRGHTAKKQWKAAALMARDLPDPWAEFGFDKVEEESVTRHMYNPSNGKWKTDEVIVKIQSKSFAHGAMRECYRMKKLSKFSQNPNWRNASNYVAKRYMKEAGRDAYFDDVKLQMDSKLWGEKYSKLNVPKKVDFCQTYIIEFKGGEGSPLYGVEHFIDGGYVKYNSNSGFVSDFNRLTPQTFSHFTFEKSDHQLIVVDIQGVGDLYTDPQMHTVDMREYGEANLGTRGMALFFSSHVCSPLCDILGLTQFDLSEKELERLRSKRWNFSSSTTKISDLPASVLALPNVEDSHTPLPEKKAHSTIGDVYRRLSADVGKMTTKPMPLKMFSERTPLEHPLPPDSPFPLDSPLDFYGGGISIHVSSAIGPGQGGDQASKDIVKSLSSCSSVGTSASASKIKTETKGADSIAHEGVQDRLQVLGLIHLDLASYHEIGRFSEDQLPNLESAMYHLDKSAHCGNAEALYTLAHIYLQQPHDMFIGLSVEATVEHESEGMEYLVEAAERGVRAAMLEVARAYDTGVGLGTAPDDADHSFTQRSQNWCEAVQWYCKVLREGTKIEESPFDEPHYTIQARVAQMYSIGGHNLEKDPQRAGDLYTEAAESAMTAMKGKLSSKYYILAEEAC